MHVKLTLLLTNSMQTKQQIQANENLEKISLPEFTGGDIFIIDDNPKLKKLCASKFDGGGGGFCEVQSPFSMACTGLS